MLPFRHILLLVILIASEARSFPRYEPQTPEDSGTPPLRVARKQQAIPEEDTTLPFDSDDDYLAEYTGFNQRGQLNNESGEKITIAEIFGRRSDDKETPKFRPDANETISAVEKALAANPKLPRLSRAEILEIFDNITMAVNQNLTSAVVKGEARAISGSVPPEYKSRAEYAKALMLVLPFNAKDMSDSKVQELYTQKPITRLLSDSEEAINANLRSKQNKNTAHQFPLPDYNELYLTSGPKLTRPTTTDRAIYRQIINVNKTNGFASVKPPQIKDTKPVDIFKPHNRFESTAQFVTGMKQRVNKTRETLGTVRPLNRGQTTLSPFNRGQQNVLQQFNRVQQTTVRPSNGGQQNIAQQYNAGQQNTAQQFNGGKQNTAQQFNGGQQNTAQQFKRGQQNVAQQLNGGQQNTAQQFNGGQQNTAQQFNGGKQNTAQQFNGGQQNTAQQFKRGQQNVAQQFNGGQQNTAQQFNGGQPNTAQQFNGGQQTTARPFKETQNKNTVQQFNAEQQNTAQQLNTVQQTTLRPNKRVQQTTVRPLKQQNIAQQFNVGQQNTVQQFNRVQQTTANPHKREQLITARPLKQQNTAQQFNGGQQNLVQQVNRLQETTVRPSSGRQTTLRPLSGGIYIVPTAKPVTFSNHRYEVTEQPKLQYVATKPVAQNTTPQPVVTQQQTPKPWSVLGNAQQKTTQLKTSTTSRTPVIQYQEIRPFQPLPDIRIKPINNDYNPVADAKIRQNALGQNYVQHPVIKQAQPDYEIPSPMTAAPKREISQYQFNNVGNSIRATTPPPVRSDIKDILASLGLFPDTNENPGATYVTTKVPIVATDMSVGAESLTPEMQEMLKSFGLLPSTNDAQAAPHHSTKKSKPLSTPPASISRPFKSTVNAAAYSSFRQLPGAKKTVSEENGVSGDMQQFLASFGLVQPENIDRSDVAVDRFDGGYRQQKSLRTTNSNRRTNNHLVNYKENKDKTVSINTEMLSDDMKRVLQSLGLLKAQEKADTETEEDELLELHASEHGHVFNPVVQMKSKKHTNEETEKLNRLLNTIENLSLKNSLISQDQKLNQLLDTVQFLTKSNITLTQQDISELNAALSLKPGDITKEVRPVYIHKNKKQKNKIPLDQKLNNPPDPVIDDLINEYIKAEKKRQQPSETSETTTTEVSYPKIEQVLPEFNEEPQPTSAAMISADTPEPDEDNADDTAAPVDGNAPASDTDNSTPASDLDSSTPTADTDSDANNDAETLNTTENTEERNPSLLSDLADSFGGGATAEEVTEEVQLPPKRPNGLYFLLDWNTFLEVGEEGKNKVSVRIAPKVGDARNFLPVTVP